MTRVKREDWQGAVFICDDCKTVLVSGPAPMVTMYCPFNCMEMVKIPTKQRGAGEYISRRKIMRYVRSEHETKMMEHGGDYDGMRCRRSYDGSYWIRRTV